MTDTTIITAKESTPSIDTGIKSLLGKKVLSSDNDVVGKIKDVVYNNNKLEGFIVKHKFCTTFIDLGLVKDYSGKSVFLKIDPIVRLLGMTVFDANGEKIGKVVELEQNKNHNKVNKIIVKKNMFSKRRSILANKIETSTKNIILRD